jgi:NAD(P)H-flavin reductase
MAITNDAVAPAVPDGMRSAPFQVLRTRTETHDSFTLTLAPRGGGGFTFAPGQFNMLLVPGVGEVPISISGKPGTAREIAHTIRALGAVTRMLQKLRRGDEVGVRGPYGTAWPVEEAAGGDVVLVAGGIGLAPLRPALYHVLAHRRRYGRVAVLIGARTPADLLFAREAETWRGRFDLEVEVTVDRGGADWFGPVGVVTTLIPQVQFDAPRTAALVCGPEIMMRYTVRELERRGVPPARVWVSLERSMKCAIGLCGHCQLGPLFVCRDGPVFRYDRVARLMAVRDL